MGSCTQLSTSELLGGTTNAPTTIRSEKEVPLPMPLLLSRPCYCFMKIIHHEWSITNYCGPHRRVCSLETIRQPRNCHAPRASLHRCAPLDEHQTPLSWPLCDILCYDATITAVLDSVSFVFSWLSYPSVLVRGSLFVSPGVGPLLALCTSESGSNSVISVFSA